MKKRMAFLLIVIMLAGLLSACGDDKKVDENKDGEENGYKYEIMID